MSNPILRPRVVSGDYPFSEHAAVAWATPLESDGGICVVLNPDSDQQDLGKEYIEVQLTDTQLAAAGYEKVGR